MNRFKKISIFFITICLIAGGFMFSPFSDVGKVEKVKASTIKIGPVCYFSKSISDMNKNRTHGAYGSRPADHAFDVGLNSHCGGNDDALAAVDGTVTFHSYTITGFGYHAELVNTDLGIKIIYAHLQNNSNQVPNNSYVTAGTHIAEIGETGNAFGKHIHLEVRDLSGGYMHNNTWEFAELGSTDPCTPPSTGTWNITTNCEISSSKSAPGDVNVKNGATLKINNGGSLNIDFVSKKLTVDPSSKVIVESTGKIY